MTRGRPLHSWVPLVRNHVATPPGNDLPNIGLTRRPRVESSVATCEVASGDEGIVGALLEGVLEHLLVLGLDLVELQVLLLVSGEVESVDVVVPLVEEVDHSGSVRVGLAPYYI